jgi:hypothetical protein
MPPAFKQGKLAIHDMEACRKPNETCNQVTARLQYARLQYARLQYARLQYARLQYARLQYGRLQYARLQHTVCLGLALMPRTSASGRCLGRVGDALGEWEMPWASGRCLGRDVLGE